MSTWPSAHQFTNITVTAISRLPLVAHRQTLSHPEKELADKFFLLIFDNEEKVKGEMKLDYFR
jgi:hypothetical protein